MRKSLKNAKQQGYIITEDGKLEHRDVYQKHHGRLPKGWVVHHIDYDKTNNKLENLIGLPSGMHDQLHMLQRKHKVAFTKSEIHAALVELGHQESSLHEEIKLRTRQLQDAEKRLGKIGLAELEKRVKYAKPIACHDNPIATTRPTFQEGFVLRKAITIQNDDGLKISPNEISHDDARLISLIKLI